MWQAHVLYGLDLNHQKCGVTSRLDVRSRGVCMCWVQLKSRSRSGWCHLPASVSWGSKATVEIALANTLTLHWASIRRKILTLKEQAVVSLSLHTNQYGWKMSWINMKGATAAAASPFSPTVSPQGRHCWFSFLSLLRWLIYLVPSSDHVDFRCGIVTSRGTLEGLGQSQGHKSQVINERFYGFSCVKCAASWRKDRGRVMEKGKLHVSDGHRCSGSFLPTSGMVLHTRVLVVEPPWRLVLVLVLIWPHPGCFTGWLDRHSPSDWISNRVQLL